MFNRKRAEVRNQIQKYAYARYMNRSHYLKWKLTDEWSVRHFFVFDKNPHLQRKFVLKSHYTKTYIILTKLEALDYIQYLALDIRPQELFSLNEIGIGYRRLIMDPESGASCFLERRLK